MRGGAIRLGLDLRLVHRVVHGAAEVPHRDDRLAAGRRQDEERVVEVGVAGHFPGMPNDSTARASGWRATAARAHRPRRASGGTPAGCGPALGGAVQDQRAAQPRQAQLHPQPAGHQIGDGPALFEEDSRPPDDFVERLAPGVRPDAGGEVAFLGPPPAADFGRQVDPAAAVVDAEVLPEVGELEGRAQAVRGLLDVAAAMAGNAEDQPSDRVRRAPAVVEDARPLGVTASRDVLPERAQQIVEQLDVQLALLPGLGDGGKDAVDGIAARGRRRRSVQPRPPVVQQTIAFRPAPESPSSAKSSAARANA